MAVNIHNLIAAISPDVYCDPNLKGEVKKLVKEKGYLEAAEVAKPIQSETMQFERARLDNVFSPSSLKNPIESHNLTYEAMSNSLEHVYFWILDYINDKYGKSEKLIDNFLSSPGSAHFSEMGQRARLMQDESMKMLGVINQVVKSILNIIYDLKEFKMRLAIYNDADSEDDNKKEAAILSLKQIWMDTVDLKRGAGSINAMAQQLDFVTLRDAFLKAESLEDVNKIDLNDRVKRVLKSRVSEFYMWKNESHRELTKRFNLEKSYLKSQVNTIKLYSRWMKPYLKAAIALEQRASPTSSLVTAFNTSLFELVILGESKYNVLGAVQSDVLPRMYNKLKLRTYSSIIITDFKFRSIPERIQQQSGYGFIGKVEVDFVSYALNEDELKILRQELEKSDVDDALKFIQGSSEDSLSEMREEIDEFLEDKNKVEIKKPVDANPFASLFSFGRKEKKEQDLSKGIPKDKDTEIPLRGQAIINARQECQLFYNAYKKAHTMPSFPPSFQ